MPKDYWTYGTYLTGHPGIKESNISIIITLTNDAVRILKFGRMLGGKWLGGQDLIFELPYSKIISVTADPQVEWNAPGAAAGLFLLGPLGALLMAQKKNKNLGITVSGKDGEGIEVKVPILFGSLGDDSMKVKSLIDNKLGEFSNITI